MTPEWDKQARRIQLGKLVARLETSGLLDKINPRKPLTLALYFGDATKADLALRWRRQDREPHHLVEVLQIDTQDMARPIVRFATNDLDGLAAELLKAVTGLLIEHPRMRQGGNDPRSGSPFVNHVLAGSSGPRSPSRIIAGPRGPGPPGPGPLLLKRLTLSTLWSPANAALLVANNSGRQSCNDGNGTGRATASGRSAKSRPSSECWSGKYPRFGDDPRAGRSRQARTAPQVAGSSRGGPCPRQDPPQRASDVGDFLRGCGESELALRWRRQATEPRHFLEVLTISPEDIARPIVRFAVNDLDALAIELLEAVSDLLTRHRNPVQLSA